MRASSKWPAESGWWTSTGDVVVGRSTPGRVTSEPMMLLTNVDLPAPVDPPITASAGASSEDNRGMT